MKKYKYIFIKQVNEEIFNKKPVYRIYNNKSNEQLGMLYYYPAWRQYVFTQASKGCIFNKSCILDILNFIDSEI